MKNEETNYNDENTQYDDAQNVKQEETNQPKKGTTWRKVAFGMGTGILLGGAASFATTRVMAANDDEEGQQDDGTFNVVEDTNAMSDGEVAIATGVSDDMSFGEAFAAARAEIGTGGAFVWQGNVYSTFTAEEWDAMTAEEREEYNSHFNWSTQTAAETEPAGQQTQEEEVEVVSVNHEEGETSSEPEEVSADVEVLGVVHDDASGANIGAMTVDGQDVYLIDVDGGDDFDYMAVDLNQDGQITEDELVDISNEQISVSHFASQAADPMYASNSDEPDYLNDTANV